MLNHQYSHPLQQQGQQQPTNTRTLGIGVRATLMMIYILIGVLFSMGVAAQSSDPPIDSTQPLYRLYSPVLGGHVYTPNAADYSQLSGIGWKPEGPAFRVMKAAGVVLGITAVPLTRLYNAALGRHVMTTDPTQVAAFGAQGWSNEGPRGYIMPSKLDGSVPVFRLYSPFFNSYLYLFISLYLFILGGDNIFIISSIILFPFIFILSFIVYLNIEDYDTYEYIR